MQVVHDRGVPLEVPVEHVLHGDLRIVDVTVVVVEDVLAPVGRAARRGTFVGLVDLVAVIPVDHAVATVGLDHGVDGHDHVLANPPIHRGVVGHEAIREFHQHLGRASLGRMLSAGNVVHRLRLRDHVLDRLGRRLPRIGERGEVAAIELEVLDGQLVRDVHDELVATLVGLAHRNNLHSRRGFFERAVVGVRLGGGGQAIGCADVATEYVLGCGDTRLERKEINQR